MDVGFENHINDINKAYNFKIKIFDFTGTILIDNNFNEWMARYDDDLIELYHKNIRGETSNYHRQKNAVCKSFKDVFKYIASHDMMLVSK